MRDTRFTWKLSTVKFVVYKSELNCNASQPPAEAPVQIDSSVSVNQQKEHFFNSLSQLGEIIPLAKALPAREIEGLCARSDIIFAGFHEEIPDTLPCRFLMHSKGSLLLPGGVLNAWTFQQSTCNLLTSQLQSNQLHEGLGPSAPRTGVFVPRLNNVFFDCYKELTRLAQRRKSKSELRMVYAGRWIANKGICQAIRALNLWPLPDAHLTMIGSYEPNFPIQWCDSTNSTFPIFFQRECLDRNRFVKLELRRPLTPQQLSEIYKNADLFLYPSFHEDENFGMAPREAILCGMTAVVSDFCGLGEVGRFQGGGLVKTFPTLAGVRYSVKELRDEIQRMAARSNMTDLDRCTAAAKIHGECSETNSLETLRSACEDLLLCKPTAPPFPGWRSKKRFDLWVSQAPAAFQASVNCCDDDAPEGLYQYGARVQRNGWFSSAHFLRAIQSLYTTLSTAPEVATNNTYRGFWRVALFAKEKAIVEFGYPGPRYLRLTDPEWKAIRDSVKVLSGGEMEFTCRHPSAVKPLQRLVDLGYVVPDIVPA